MRAGFARFEIVAPCMAYQRQGRRSTYIPSHQMNAGRIALNKRTVNLAHVLLLRYPVHMNNTSGASAQFLLSELYLLHAELGRRPCLDDLCTAVGQVPDRVRPVLARLRHRGLVQGNHLGLTFSGLLVASGARQTLVCAA